jgi:histidinol-phosphate aminotransferase
MIDITKLVRPNIRSLVPYSSARSEFSGNADIFLDANENPFGKLNRYPDPLQKVLKNEISRVKGIPVKNIFLGNGSDEIIDLCYRIFCEPGKDKALTFVPTYGMYEVSAQINDVALIKVPLDKDFQVDRDTLGLQLTQKDLKLIFICSPNNPTGNTITAIDAVLENFGGIVVIDEAYSDFSYTSLAKKIDAYPNLIVLQTLSKAWGAAAARVGMAFCNENIISFFNKVKPPYNISEPNQEFAIASLKEVALFKQQLKVILAEKERMVRELEDIPFVMKIYPSETNFILVEVSDADAVYDLLVKGNIIIRNRNGIIKNCLRITIGTPLENKALLTALQKMKL